MGGGRWSLWSAAVASVYHPDVIEQSADELIDVLDENGVPTGERKTRGRVHQDGDWHRVVHVWIVRENGDVLLQRRSRAKATEPGKLDVTVGGHLLAGELGLDAVREVAEEIGLELRPGALTHLGTSQGEYEYPGWVNREVQDVYAVRDETPLTDYVLKLDEVDVLYEVPLARAIALVVQGAYVPAPGYDAMQRVNNALLTEDDLPTAGREQMAAELRLVMAWHVSTARESDRVPPAPDLS